MIERFINRLKIDNSLTAESLESLLRFLGPDEEAAATAYLEVRRALFTFFVARGGENPDEMADETLNRIARRLSEGAEITAENPSSYFYAVARNVLREQRSNAHVLAPLPEGDQAQSTETTPYDLMVYADDQVEAEARRESLQTCLNQLLPEERELIVAYYQFSGGAKIENRKNLAVRFNLSNNTLRQKIARLRSKLAECVSRRLRARARPNFKKT
jgi:RNA polymerase sigma factor (sigma-70 family)